MTATVPAPSMRRSRGARVLRAVVLAAAAAAATVAGVYVAGGVITNDFRLSMALTALWFASAGAASLASFKAGRSIGIPLLAGYLIAATATGGYLAATTLRDKTVHETVVTGMPAAELPAARGEAPANVQESSGHFRSGEHATSGTARIVRLAGGRRVLTLTGFETAAGPDLRVRMSPATARTAAPTARSTSAPSRATAATSSTTCRKASSRATTRSQSIRMDMPIHTNPSSPPAVLRDPAKRSRLACPR